MVVYRRNFVVGGSCFFTVTLLDRQSHLLVDRIDELRAAFRLIRKRHPFEINAMLVMPDHLHCIWTLPSGDTDFPMRWREIKSYFTRCIPDGEYRSQGRLNKKERGAW